MRKLQTSLFFLALQNDHAMLIQRGKSVLHFLEEFTIPEHCCAQILMRKFEPPFWEN